MKLSAVLIVKNEEVLLPKCLESLKGIDEIIVCDTGSGDNTIEVAKKYTDKVFNDYTWNDNYAEARNHALKKATGDWILSIDADETLDDLEEVRKTTILAEQQNIKVVDCLLHTIDHSKNDWEFPRLFKRCPEVFWNGEIHNHLSIQGVKVGNVSISVGYSPAHQLDPQRSYRILKNIYEGGRAGSREKYYYGRELFYYGEYEKAVQILGEYVVGSSFLGEKADAFLIMARAYWAMSMPNDARDACVQCLIINPHFKEAILFMAKIAGDGYGNPIWQHKADQWKKLAETADNSEVLFVRT